MRRSSAEQPPRGPPTATGIAAHSLDLRFLDRDLGQEHLVLGGRAIAYTFAIAQLIRWAAAVRGDATGRAHTAIEFLKADIDGIAREFDLLATGILDHTDRADGQRAGAGAP